jgi:hypothetical protein
MEPNIFNNMINIFMIYYKQNVDSINFIKELQNIDYTKPTFESKFMSAFMDIMRQEKEIVNRINDRNTIINNIHHKIIDEIEQRKDIYVEICKNNQIKNMINKRKALMRKNRKNDKMIIEIDNILDKNINRDMMIDIKTIKEIEGYTRDNIKKLNNIKKEIKKNKIIINKLERDMIIKMKKSDIMKDIIIELQQEIKKKLELENDDDEEQITIYDQNDGPSYMKDVYVLEVHMNNKEEHKMCRLLFPLIRYTAFIPNLYERKWKIYKLINL